jgi:fluoroquinolone transport system permease protein
MRSNLATLIRHDARLQFRYGIYAAYAVVVALYVAALASLGSRLPPAATAFIIFSDPAALGFFFLGGLVMLERSEGVRAPLAVTPMTVSDYLGAKILTLTGVALVACVALYLAGQHSGDLPLLLATVALTSILYVGLGVPVALGFRTVSGYLMGSVAFLTPVVAPSFLALLDPFPIWLGIIPSVSQFRLMMIGTGAVSGTPIEAAFMLGICLAAAAGAAIFAHRALSREWGR